MLFCSSWVVNAKRAAISACLRDHHEAGLEDEAVLGIGVLEEHDDTAAREREAVRLHVPVDLEALAHVVEHRGLAVLREVREVDLERAGDRVAERAAFEIDFAVALGLGEFQPARATIAGWKSSGKLVARPFTHVVVTPAASRVSRPSRTRRESSGDPRRRSSC